MPGSPRGSSSLAFAGGGTTGYFIDFGTEAPLTVGATAGSSPARRAVSVRWLSGTILTGLTSFVLMGGALMVALNGQNMIAAPPQIADTGIIGANLVTGQKGDRILPVASPPTTSETIPVAVTVREGDRDLIIQRPFIHINAALAAATADGIVVPPYDPVAIVGEAANSEPADLQPTAVGDFAEGDALGGDAAVRTLAFPFDAVFGEPPPLNVDDVQQIVQGNATLFGVGGETVFGVLAYADAAGFGVGQQTVDPLAQLGIRAIPENVDYLAKTSDAGVSRNERVLTVEEGMTAGTLLADAALGEGDIQAALAVMGGLIDLEALSPRDRLRIAFTTNAAEAPYLLRLSIYEDDVHQATVARNDEGIFIRADAPAPLPDTFQQTPSRVLPGAMPSLYEGLYLTAIGQSMPVDQINELIRIFAFDLDLQARIGPGDAVELFRGVEEGGDGGPQPILFASVTTGGATTTYYRFQTPDGVVKYYNADGYSADNFLLRKPMSGGELRSHYGMRLHPVLGVYRMHAGVDWSAPRGTPLVAAGDGLIVQMEYNSGGYGYYTVIRHELGYETAYAHQSGFAPGLAEGDTVRQGQVIGFVGSTGLSTGNHLHYEVRINGQTVNPLTVRLPEGRVLTGDELVAFQEQRDQINALLGFQPGTEIAAAP
jgi:murein DD-endopeptidase MepM/ murein hydrolase activator NlpD